MTDTDRVRISTELIPRKLVRTMLVILLGLLVCLAVLTSVMLAYSSGKPKPFLDSNGIPLAGSISEKIHVMINGIDQGMFVRGKDKTKPVLLFLHGGPGLPEYAISYQYPAVLEDDFVVCWWEQRGAGLSFHPDIPLETMTFEQLITDTIEVTNYLRKRFGQGKIYLMAHSGGSFIGIQAAAQAPELYKAYIAISQISNQLESEKLAYKYMVEQFTRLGDNNTLRKLEKYSIAEINTPSYYAMRDAPMHKLGIGTTHKMKSIISGVFMPVMLNSEYTLGEKINIWRGKFFTSGTADLWCKLVETDLTMKVLKLEIPVYFFSGIYDYTVNYTLAKEYFAMLQAPRKGFYTFEHSAHSPLYEEPEKMQSIMRGDVLPGLFRLAD
jgi:pimeloyl-ACP methyl ester carboxylesterase